MYVDIPCNSEYGERKFYSSKYYMAKFLLEISDEYRLIGLDYDMN